MFSDKSYVATKHNNKYTNSAKHARACVRACVNVLMLLSFKTHYENTPIQIH